MSAIPTIRKGEDLPFAYDLGGEDISGWDCIIQVSQTPQDEFAVISRPISPTGNAWVGFLTSDETSALNVSSDTPYLLTAFLTNSLIEQARQIPKRFHVSPAWA